MARTESINIDGEIELCVNISKIVGHAGANLYEDVILIQALFKYIADGLGPAAIGLGGDFNVPAISGEMDADTYSAIIQFQIQNAHQLLKHSFDGRIHPANYKNRVIKDSRKGVMAITLLHLLAHDSSVFHGNYHYKEALIKLKPELATYLDRSLFL